MQITLFFCENANTGTDAKLNIQGVYNELYAKGFPAKQDVITLAGMIEWNHQDQGKKEFQIDILDPENQSIFTINAHSEVESRDVSRPPSVSHLIFPLENLIFTQAGKYSVSTTIENKKVPGPALYLITTKSGT